MNKKMLVLNALTISMVVCIPLVMAWEPDEVTVWTDKQKYAPGERGVLYVAFYNCKDEEILIQNITILYYNWTACISETWVGNETRTVDIHLSGKKTHVFNDITFIVPTDGRAVDTGVYVKVGTDDGYKDSYGYITILEVPIYMEQIVTLFTIQVVLIIVCTIIVSATMFLSSRRPQIMWQKEEGEE